MKINNNQTINYPQFSFYKVLRIFISIMLVEIFVYGLMYLFPVLRENTQVAIWLNITFVEVTLMSGFILFLMQKLAETRYTDWFVGLVFIPITNIIEALSWFTDNYILKAVLSLFGTLAMIAVHITIFFGILTLAGKYVKR